MKRTDLHRAAWPCRDFLSSLAFVTVTLPEILLALSRILSANQSFVNDRAPLVQVKADKPSRAKHIHVCYSLCHLVSYPGLSRQPRRSLIARMREKISLHAMLNTATGILLNVEVVR